MIPAKNSSLSLARSTASNDQWLTLDQASRRLGVHPTTLRRWAKQGAIGVFLTPGGHRRFLLADVERFEEEHHHSRRGSTREQQWSEWAIARTRQTLPREQWVAQYSESERESFRHLGRRLIGLLLQFAVRPHDGETVLSEARAIGRQHASQGQDVGRPLLDMLRTIGFFRLTMLEVAIIQMPKVSAGQPEASVHLLRRIEQLVDEVQTGVVESYQDGS